MLSEIFWTFLVTSILGCMLATTRMLYKSKCRSVECCGLKIIRDVEGEEKIDERIIPSLEKRDEDLI